jgi:hypothetical protein
MQTTLRSTLRRLEREAERKRPVKILLLFPCADGVYRTLDGRTPRPARPGIPGDIAIHCYPGEELI